jgi:hypothetical protein
MRGSRYPTTVLLVRDGRIHLSVSSLLQSRRNVFVRPVASIPPYLTPARESACYAGRQHLQNALAHLGSKARFRGTIPAPPPADTFIKSDSSSRDTCPIRLQCSSCQRPRSRLQGPQDELRSEPVPAQWVGKGGASPCSTFVRVLSLVLAL